MGLGVERIGSIGPPNQLRCDGGLMCAPPAVIIQPQPRSSPQTEGITRNANPKPAWAPPPITSGRSRVQAQTDSRPISGFQACQHTPDTLFDHRHLASPLPGPLSINPSTTRGLPCRYQTKPPRGSTADHGPAPSPAPASAQHPPTLRPL